jgi:multimeric flavodoxin WrbA
MNSSSDSDATPSVRTGQGSTRLSQEEFEKRYRMQFYDPAFDGLEEEIGRLSSIAWEAYQDGRKSARTRTAGPGFADPTQELSVEWLETRAAIQAAELLQKSAGGNSRILLICSSPRTDETCPSEISKTFRIATVVRSLLDRTGDFTTDFLDLSHLGSEYGRRIYPCKGCVSTAMPLCHWPCSCYPHHALGQVHDWMQEIYPRWVAAHGVMIITPVHWNQATSGLKLMMDRLVCADGGNPDPTTTDGKDALKAKTLELDGWLYPRHLAGRIFSLIVHGDTEGVDALLHHLHDWLTAMDLVSAGATAEFARHVGYYEPYATSHEALDRDTAFMREVENATATLMAAVKEMRNGRQVPGAELESPRPK